MEDDNHNPSEIDRVDDSKVLQSSIPYLNKKRKFQEDQLGLPLPKHKFWKQVVDFPSNENLRIEDSDPCTIKGKAVAGARDDESELKSAKENNSFSGDMDSSTSLSVEAKIKAENSKTFPSDRPSTSSGDWDGSSFGSNLHSLDGRSAKEADVDKLHPSCIGGDDNFPHNDFGLYSCLNFDEHPLEFGSHMDYSCLEHRNDSVEQCTDNELEVMLYSSGTPPDNFLLSSGRLSSNQETGPSTENLTIDKEFEQYFSMLLK